jgi:hypothetical protein
MERIFNILYWQKPKEKAIKLIEAICIMGIASLIYPTTIMAANLFHVSGPFVDAGFSSTDPPGCVCPSPNCISTSVFISITDNRIQSPPGPVQQPVPFINELDISQYDCTLTPIFITFGCQPQTLTTTNFQISNKLDSATLNVTLECFDFVSSTSVNVSANLTWSATSAPTSEHATNHVRSPGCIVNQQFDGTFRAAQASGILSDATTNFTPNPADFADIAFLKEGTISVGCQ